MTTAPIATPGRVPALRPHRGIGERLGAIGRPPRIMGLDIARGLAIIGMAAAHMIDPAPISWGDPATWGGIVHGRPSILFALIAGVSTAILTGRTTRPTRADMPAARALLVRRGLTIFAIGLALELLNTNIAVILCVYGVLFLCAIPFLRWSLRRLALAAAAVGVVAPFLLAALHVLLFSPVGPGVSLAIFGVYPVPVWLAFLLAGMAIGRIDFAPLRIAAGLMVVGIGLAIVGYAGGAFVMAELDGAASLPQVAAASAEAPGGQAPVAPGETGTGGGAPTKAAVVEVPGSKLGTLDGTGLTCDTIPGQWINCYPQSARQAASDAGAGSYGTRLAASDPVHEGLISALAVSEHSGGLFEIIGSGGFAIAVLGFCLLIARPLRWLLLPVACAGMMPLTIYSAHVIVYCVAAGGPAGSFGSSIALWAWSTAALVVAATLWTATFGRGPLERLLAHVARGARTALGAHTPQGHAGQPAGDSAASPAETTHA